MTASTSGTGSGADTSQVKEQAKQSAQQAASTAADEGKHVAGVATDEVKQVASEAKEQALDLFDELRSQVSEQASTQLDRLVQTLKDFAQQLDSMAESSDRSGVATQVVRQMSDRAKNLRSNLEGREPSDLLDEVRDLGRRKPGAFLLGALAAGVVAGRITRGAKKDTSSSSDSYSYRGSSDRLPVPTGTTGTTSTGTTSTTTATFPSTAPPVAVPPVSTPPPPAYPSETGAAGDLRDIPPLGAPTGADPVEPGLPPYPDTRSGGNP